MLRALRRAFHLPLDGRQIAHLTQKSENRFVGAQVGIMDPMACSLGEMGMALFLDTRSLASECIPLPAGGDMVVINSGIAHQHSEGDYNTRRAECEAACSRLGVKQLRDLGETDLPRLAALAPPLDRRARHVILENARVLATVEALRAGDLDRVGELFLASHASQRDDYQVSIREIDLLVELSRQDPEVYGARLTGGGFGGSIVMLSEGGRGHATARRLTQEYQSRTGRQAVILACLAGGE
jgi:galactokinase